MSVRQTVSFQDCQ